MADSMQLASFPCFPELVIDLHGYSIEKAKFCILHTLAYVHNVNKIRIITGRGNHINRAGERGILYKTLRSWLQSSAYQGRIDKICTYDGYYELHLKGGNLQQQLFKDVQISFNQLFSDPQAIKLKADQGEPSAQFAFAVYLTDGAKDEKDFKLAFSYFLRAANSGYADAMISVATSYMVGRGVRQNDIEAMKWLQLALKLNHLEAPVLLGDCYWNGYGVQQDPTIAVSYYAKGAAQNDPVAMRKLASAYNTGIGLRKMPHKAFEWYKKAADLGETTSQYNIAVVYEKGCGSSIKPDIKEAHRYYLLAAHGGDPDAQCKIGSFYLDGKSVAPNQKEAIKWLTLAAENGSSQAVELLKWHKPVDLTVLQQSAQTGNILDSVELKLQQRGLIATAEVLDTLFVESYLELRDLPIPNLMHLGHKAKFFLVDQLLIDKKKCYQQKALEALNAMAEGKCVFSLRRLAHAYHNGLGVKKNDRQTVIYLEQARRLQDGKSITALAGFCKSRVPGGMQPSQSLRYYEEAAVLGYPPANYYLGLFCLDRQETKKGITFLQKAVDLEMDIEKCKAVFASGFIDKYTTVGSDAAFRLGMEYCRSGNAKQVKDGFRYLQLAEQWGSENATRFLEDAKAAGFLGELYPQLFEPIIQESITPDSNPVFQSGILCLASSRKERNMLYEFSRSCTKTTVVITGIAMAGAAAYVGYNFAPECKIM